MLLTARKSSQHLAWYFVRSRELEMRVERLCDQRLVISDDSYHNRVSFDYYATLAVLFTEAV